MVTAPEAAALLATASTFDNRKMNPGAPSAWAEVLHDVSFRDAHDAVMNHYGKCSEWLMPSDILAAVRAVEAERVANGPDVDFLEPPDWLALMEDGPEFNLAYTGWLQDTRRRIRQGVPIEVGPVPVLSERQMNPNLAVNR